MSANIELDPGIATILRGGRARSARSDHLADRGGDWHRLPARARGSVPVPLEHYLAATHWVGGRADQLGVYGCYCSRLDTAPMPALATAPIG
jgi:hypothetical protein